MCNKHKAHTGREEERQERHVQLPLDDTAAAGQELKEVLMRPEDGTEDNSPEEQQSWAQWCSPALSSVQEERAGWELRPDLAGAILSLEMLSQKQINKILKDANTSEILK